MSDDNTPIEPQNYLHGINVVQIGDLRIARGRAIRERETCRHLNLSYSDDERRVFCADCKNTISGFDAFKALTTWFHVATNRLDERDKALREAESHSLLRIVTKKLDVEWSKHSTAPCCPHCERGLLPEDFMGKIKHVSKSIEQARRKKQENAP